MNYVFYPDVFWLTNFVMDMLVLLLVRYFRKSRSSLRRILLASAVGATGAVLLFLSLDSYLLYQFLVHFMLNPIMVFLSFPLSGIKRFIKDFLLVYLMMLLLGGILSWGMETLGQWKYFGLWAVGACGICALLIHFLEGRRLQQQNYEVLILTEQGKFRVKGFLDTGNLLRDPIVNQPVHIIQEEILKEEFLENQPAIRYIPFHSLGQERGLLPVVTLKAMYIKPMGEKEEIPPIYLEKPVFGLAKENLFQKKNYQVILNAGSLPV